MSKGLTRSLQRELNSFFSEVQGTDYSIAEVTKGALTHARKKLKPEAFKELNQEALRSFYEEAPWRKWRGHRLLACDGSTMVLPRHPTTENEFGLHGFGSKADSQNCIATISLLYDVLNLTTLDSQLGKYVTSERELLNNHLAQITFGNQDLLLLDRGYAGIALMHELQQKGIAFCMRLTDNWWKEVRQMVEKGEKDKLATFELPALYRKQMKTEGKEANNINCRIVIIDFPDGSKEVLCTSLTDTIEYEYECFKELYHYRWRVEEDYKLLKCRASLEVFSGKSAQAVKQDFYAKIFMITMCAILSFPIDQKVKAEYNAAVDKYAKQINRTNALSIVKETWLGMFLKRLFYVPLAAIDDILAKTCDIIRPNRTFKRKKRLKRPPSMHYKQL